MSYDEYQPIDSHTEAFVRLQAESNGGTISSSDACSELTELFHKFLLVLSTVAIAAGCYDHADQDKQWNASDSVVAGAFWIKVPNVAFCSSECASAFARFMRSTMGRYGMCDVCNRAVPLTDYETIVPFSNLVIVTHTCQACLEKSPRLTAKYN